MQRQHLSILRDRLRCRPLHVSMAAKRRKRQWRDIIMLHDRHGRYISVCRVKQLREHDKQFIEPDG